MMPLALLTAEGLLVPLIEWLRTLTSGSPGGALPWHYYVKLIGFGVLTYLGLFQLVIRLKALYYCGWAYQFRQADPMHVPYQHTTAQTMWGLFNWRVFRALIVFGPPVAMVVILGVLGIIGLNILNALMGMPFIGLSVQLTIGLFLGMMLGVVTFLVILNAVRMFVVSAFGDPIAATEPDLPAKTVYERSGRLLFVSPWVVAFWGAWLGFWGLTLWAITTLLMHYNISDILALRLPYLQIMLVETGLVVLYLATHFIRFYSYHRALRLYYQRLAKRLAAARRSQSTQQRHSPSY